MSLGDQVKDALAAGHSGPLDVEEGQIEAHVDVVGSGPYGADIRRITVQRKRVRGEQGRGQRMQRAVDALKQRLSYLPERIEPLELDPASGRGLLRTAREQVRGKEYYEVVVDGGDRVDMQRLRWGQEGGAREQVADNLGQRIIGRLIDDLGEIVGED